MGHPPRFDYDLGHLLGAGVLLLSFALLGQRRLPAMIHLYAGQAMLLAAAAAWQGWVQAAPALYLTAAITLALKVLLIPLVLSRIVARMDLRRATEPALGVFAATAAGLALVVLSVIVVLPTTAASLAVTREDLALALSVVLLGLLAMITRRSVLTQAIGFLSLENGLVLAAIGVVGMPLVVELSVAVFFLAAFTVFGIFFFRIRARFDSLDLHHLDRVGGAHR